MEVRKYLKEIAEVWRAGRILFRVIVRSDSKSDSGPFLEGVKAFILEGGEYLEFKFLICSLFEAIFQ